MAFTRLAELLLEFSEVERGVEVTRQVLLENINFDPCHAFWHLDRRNTNQISIADLGCFLEENNILTTRSELQSLFNHLDQNRDGIIDWPEFITTVISKEGSFYEVGRSTFTLPLEVEHSLARVFGEELAGLKRLEALKRALRKRPGFSLEAGFDHLDREKKGWISERDLFRFMDSQIGPVTHSISERTLRRLDTDCDGKIVFREWKQNLTPSGIAPEPLTTVKEATTISRSPIGKTSVVRTSIGRTVATRQSPGRIEAETSVRVAPNRNFISKEIVQGDVHGTNLSRAELQRSIERSIEHKQAESKIHFHRSPGRGQTRWAASPTRVKVHDEPVMLDSPVRSRTYTTETVGEIHYATPEKIFRSTADRLEESNFEYEDRVRASEIIARDLVAQPRAPQVQTLIGFDDRHLLIESLKEFFRDYREIEEKKINLSLRFDITMDELFQLADRENTGLISPEDLHLLLKEAKTGTIFDDAFLLVARYDRDEDGYLNFAEYQEMLAPFSIEYRKAMQARTPRKIAQFRDYTLQTKRTFKDLVVSIIGAEENQDFERERVRHRLLSLFNMIDQNGRGQISLRDLGDALADFGLNTTYRELRAIIRKFDLNCDGKISFPEFVEGMSPKKFSTPSKMKKRIFKDIRGNFVI